MDDINDTNATAAQKCVADIWARLEQHDQEHGTSQRNDQELWRLLDSMDLEALVTLKGIAKQHTDYRESEYSEWFAELKQREPFKVRLKSERYKANPTNNLIWKLTMLAKEIIRGRLKRDPKRDLFE
jgi:hypothetical protein